MVQEIIKTNSYWYREWDSFVRKLNIDVSFQQSCVTAWKSQFDKIIISLRNINIEQVLREVEAAQFD